MWVSYISNGFMNDCWRYRCDVQPGLETNQDNDALRSRDASFTTAALFLMSLSSAVSSLKEIDVGLASEAGPPPDLAT